MGLGENYLTQILILEFIFSTLTSDYNNLRTNNPISKSF